MRGSMRFLSEGGSVVAISAVVWTHAPLTQSPVKGAGLALKPPVSPSPPFTPSALRSTVWFLIGLILLFAPLSRSEWQPSGLSGNSANTPSNKSVSCTCPPQGSCLRRLEWNSPVLMPLLTNLHERLLTWVSTFLAWVYTVSSAEYDAACF